MSGENECHSEIVVGVASVNAKRGECSVFSLQVFYELRVNFWVLVCHDEIIDMPADGLLLSVVHLVHDAPVVRVRGVPKDGQVQAR